MPVLVKAWGRYAATQEVLEDLDVLISLISSDYTFLLNWTCKRRCSNKNKETVKVSKFFTHQLSLHLQCSAQNWAALLKLSYCTPALVISCLSTLKVLTSNSKHKSAQKLLHYYILVLKYLMPMFNMLLLHLIKKGFVLFFFKWPLLNNIKCLNLETMLMKLFW